MAHVHGTFVGGRDNIGDTDHKGPDIKDVFKGSAYTSTVDTQSQSCAVVNKLAIIKHCKAITLAGRGFDEVHLVIVGAHMKIAVFKIH